MGDSMGEMKDITTIPLDELLDDWDESMSDARWCAYALSCDIETFERKSVAERLQANMRIVDAIDQELARRQAVR